MINRYNGEYPDRWFDDLKEYLSINPNKHPNIRKFIENPTFNKEYFNNLCDKYRSPHLWEKKIICLYRNLELLNSYVNVQIFRRKFKR